MKNDKSKVHDKNIKCDSKNESEKVKVERPISNET